MDKKLSCVLFSTAKKRERESREQRCQSTETTISIHFRAMRRSVGGGSNSSDFFSLSPFSLYKVQKREKKKK